MDLERFVRAFGFNMVRVKHDRPIQRIDRFDSYSASYYTDYDRTIIELEIGRKELEHMADYFTRMEQVNKEDFDEACLRNEHPALKEAYGKYKMLLELYK